MRRYVLIISIVCALCACARKATICGVPYESKTPWQLAAALCDESGSRFTPETVDIYCLTKAKITGWSFFPGAPAPYDDGFVPDTIYLDLHNGKVTHAVLGSEIPDNE